MRRFFMRLGEDKRRESQCIGRVREFVRGREEGVKERCF
jgi:hypothetical protein